MLVSNLPMASTSMLLVAGKAALVTGGGSGIGRAICEKLAANGARLIVVDVCRQSADDTANYLQKQQQSSALDGHHLSTVCDVSNSADVGQLCDWTLTQLNGHAPDIVVSCAGITMDSTLAKMTEESFDRVIAVNLKSVFLVSQVFSRAALSAKSSQSIINISSIVGKIGNFGQSNYAASKAGMIGFSKTAARELAAKGIRVNCILPGFIQTPMTQKMPAKVLEGICQQIPMNRMGVPEDIANATLFLASDLSSYITGATIEVTGGYVPVWD